MSSRKGGTASTSNRSPTARLLQHTCGHSPAAAAAVWLTQVHRLLDSADLPTHVATVRSTQEGPLISIELPPEAANAVLEWALEAAGRVLRGDPQPSAAEVYKAARALLS